MINSIFDRNQNGRILKIMQLLQVSSGEVAIVTKKGHLKYALLEQTGDAEQLNYRRFDSNDITNANSNQVNSSLI